MDLAGIELPKPPLLEMLVCAGCGGGDFTDPDDGKLRPLNASVRPPKESCCFAGGDDKPPKEACRL